MTGITPYLRFPGVAREALSFYQAVFGGEVTLHTYAEFGRADGPGDDIAHGVLQGVVSLYACDASGDESALEARGLMFALLGAAEPATLTSWFDALATDGRVVDPLERRPWGAVDGTVTDPFGVTWLVGYEN